MNNSLTATSLFCSAVLILGFATNSPAQTSPVSLRTPNNSDTDSTVLQINKLVEQVWTDYELKPSREATDGEWCRRVYLDIIGRVPSYEEATEFMESRDSDKKKKLVEKLLYDDLYTEEFARNWTTVWTNLLIGRTGGNDNNSMISRPGMQKYL
ncbi:MAG: DUF1549 domain-containing protein, partial [Planctomycetaceae bacterium]|nr:DUF1549 domain-containing protein [Planctomycetaceae bacterium]